MTGHPVYEDHLDRRDLGERLADRLASGIGSWRFLLVQTAGVATWMVLNHPGARGWDPYPWILLNLLFSVQAAYAGPTILLSQKRQAQRDRLMAEHDLACDQRSEELIRAVHRRLDRMEAQLGRPAQRAGVSRRPSAIDRPPPTPRGETG